MEQNDKAKTVMLIITGVSGSGKTTLANQLKELGTFKQPLQFTTRTPRSDKEMDDYVFLSKEMFLKKLENGDFCEHVIYGDNYYGLGAYFDTSVNNVAILDPIGKVQVEKYCKMNGIRVISIYLEIDKDTMEDRLGMKRGESMSTIEKRKTDFLYFSPAGYNYVIDGKDSSANVLRHVQSILKTNGIS